MILIIGLGNPGKKYKYTRHNVGFQVIDKLAKIKRKGWILAKPQTFMNQSGKAVKKLIKTYYPNQAMAKLSELLWVIHDDIDIPLGQFKISFGRGSAGHKGVQSIINELGTKDFWRLRIGVSPKSGKPQNVEKFVLQNFTKSEEKIIKEVIEKVAQEIKK